MIRKPAPTLLQRMAYGTVRPADMQRAHGSHAPWMASVTFGGPDLRTAYITLSSTGRLVSMTWERPGLGLHHLNH